MFLTAVVKRFLKISSSGCQKSEKKLNTNRLLQLDYWKVLKKKVKSFLNPKNILEFLELN